MGLADGILIEGETPRRKQPEETDQTGEYTPLTVGELQAMSLAFARNLESRVRNQTNRAIRRINAELMREAKEGKYSATVRLVGSHKALDRHIDPELYKKTYGSDIEVTHSKEKFGVRVTDQRLREDDLVANSVITEYRMGGMKISKAPDEDAINIAWERPNE